MNFIIGMVLYGNLQPIIWNYLKSRCAGVEILQTKVDTISITQVSELLVIDRRWIAELRPQLKDTRDPPAVVEHPL